MKIIGVQLTTPDHKELISLVLNLIFFSGLYLIGHMIFDYELLPGIIVGLIGGLLSKAYGIDVSKGWRHIVVWAIFIVFFIFITQAALALWGLVNPGV